VWSVNVGSAVDGGLTTRGGRIYVPGADGVVHVLNATTGAAGTSITPFWSGAVTQPVTFDAGGTAYIVQANAVSAEAPGGGGGGSSYGGGVSFSSIAVGGGTGFMTSTDGTLHEAPSGWTTTVGAAGCDVAPVFANGVVYASACDTIGAYEAGSGSPLWTLTSAGQPQGMAIANGVLYVCSGSKLRAYVASYGGLISTIGPCAVAPEIALGTVYTTYNVLDAFTLTGAQTTIRRQRPNLTTLKPHA
jgi:hypothetical protein